MDKKKKIVFEDLEVNYAKLKIRLRHDGLGQSDFFSFIVQKYIACDPQFLFFVDELKESRSKFGKRRLKKSLDDIKKGEELMNDLGISGSSSNSALITAPSSCTTSEINLQNASFWVGSSSLK